MDTTKQYGKGCQTKRFTKGFKACDSCRAKQSRRCYNNTEHHQQKRTESKETNERAKANASKKNIDMTAHYVNMLFSEKRNLSSKQCQKTKQ